MSVVPTGGDVVFLQLQTAADDKLCVCGFLAATSRKERCDRVVIPAEAARLLGLDPTVAVPASRGEGTVDVAVVTAPRGCVMMSRPPQWSDACLVGTKPPS